MRSIDGLTHTVFVQEILESLAANTTPSQYTDNQYLLQTLNMIMSRCPSSTAGITCPKFKDKFFTYEASGLHSLGKGLVALRGFYTSVWTSTLQLLLNINTVTAAFYQIGNLLDLISAFKTEFPRNADPRLKVFLRGLRVELEHLKPKSVVGGKKIKVICGLVKGSTGRIEATGAEVLSDWTKDNGSTERITVKEYYKKPECNI